MSVSVGAQKERAERFRRLHSGPQVLVLPNAWDAASTRVLERSGFAAIATTSSGVAAALGYGDGQQISRDMLVDVTTRITRVVSCLVTVDVEAGYGASISEVVQTVREVIEAGAVGINIEDSSPSGGYIKLADVPYQVALIKALRKVGASLDVPFVINARVDTFLLPVSVPGASQGGAPQMSYEEAVRRANAYLLAGADCVYPIGVLSSDVIARLVEAIRGLINVLGGPGSPNIHELRLLGVARVSFADRLMRSVLGHLHLTARELLEQGTYGAMETEMLSSSDFDALFAHEK